MKFKYAEKISALDIVDCPPKEAQKIEGVDFIYRWVHEDIAHKNNFIPVLEIQPARVQNFKSNAKKCSGFALSMHDSLENSRRHFQNLRENLPNFPQIVGNFIAELKIKTGDGCRTYPSVMDFDFGHFDFFESEHLNLSARIFEIYEI
jgi:hypothetical protein